jgi:hypothetical protein
VIALMVGISTLQLYSGSPLDQSGGCAEGDGQQHRDGAAGGQRTGRKPLVRTAD